MDLVTSKRGAISEILLPTVGGLFDFFVYVVIAATPLIIGVGNDSFDLRWQLFTALSSLCLSLFFFKAYLSRDFAVRPGKLGALFALAAIFLIGRIIAEPSQWPNTAGWLAWLCFIPILAGSFRSRAKLQWGLFLYSLSSGLLAAFTIVWFVIAKTLIYPAGGEGATALWFLLNLFVILAVVVWGGVKVKFFWYFSFALHLLLLILFDYSLVWYFLLASTLGFLIFCLYSKKKRELGICLLAGAGVLVASVFLFVRVENANSNLGVKIPVGAYVPNSLAWSRFWRVEDRTGQLFGSGFTRSGERFWQLGELVNWPGLNNFPALGGSYLDLLWMGGILSVIFLVLFAVFVYLGRQKNYWLSLAKERFGLAPFFSLLFALVLLWFSPLNFLLLLSASFFGGAVLAGHRRRGREFQLPAAGHKFFLILAMALLLLAVFLFYFFGRTVKAGLLYNQAFRAVPGGAEVNLSSLAKAIDISPSPDSYRLTRLKVLLSGSPADYGGSAALIKSELDYFSARAIKAPEYWRLAFRASRLAEQAGDLEEKKYLLTQAGSLYDKALLALPRNVVLKTEISRFWREHANFLIKDGEVPAGYYKKAQDLIDETLRIDSSYSWAYLEKAELLLLAGNPAAALEALGPFAGDNSFLALRAGQIAFSMQKFKEAEDFYLLARAGGGSAPQTAGQGSAISWSAGYELARTYSASGQKALAEKQLLELGRLKNQTAEQAALLESLRNLLNQ